MASRKKPSGKSSGTSAVASSDRQDPGHALVLAVRAAGAPGSGQGKEQKQFNKLVKDLDKLRQQIAQWQDYLPKLQQQVAARLDPIVARNREASVQLVRTLSRAIDGAELSRLQTRKAIEIVCWHLTGLLDEGPDEELSALHARYAKESPAPGETADARRIRPVIDDLFGVDDEELEWPTGENPDDDAPAPRPSAREQARAARHAQLAQDASRSLRDLYRRIASELHPDREPDAAEQARKTALMQQANQAYASRDLLALLGLQLAINQLDPAALRNLERERLRHYNYALENQLEQLHEELAALTAPFDLMFHGRPRDLTPDVVERVFAQEVRDMRRLLKAREAENVYFSDVRNLKMMLNDYRLGDLVEDELDADMLDDVMDDMLDALRRPARGGRS